MNWKAAWTVPLVLAANVASAQTAHPASGEVIFSELFIAPPGSKTTYEYVELYSLAENAFTVDGCYLAMSASSSSCDTSVPGLENVTGGCRPITAGGTIAPGQRALFVRDEAKWGPDGCNKTVGGTYPTVSMSNTVVETISLYCNPPGGADELERVASFTYDWANAPDKETGHTYQLREDYFTLEDGAAQDPRHWCVAPADAWMCAFDDNGTTRDMYGTPGAANVCEAEVRHPAPGEVAFNEINAWPSTTGSSPDWIELSVDYAPADEPLYDLKGCQIGIATCPNDDPADCLADTTLTYSSSKSDTFDILFSLAQDQLVVVATGDTPGCVQVNTDPADAVEDYSCERWADLAMDVSLSSDSTLRRIDLDCPDDDTFEMRTVDSVVYNHAWVKDACCQADGHCSWELRSERTGDHADDPYLANDEVDNWGVAPARTAYSSSVDMSEEPPAVEENYASPGAVNAIAARPETAIVAQGDVTITEIAWSSSAPDWIEMEVTGDPGVARFDLNGCILRTLDCDAEEMDPATCLAEPWDDIAWTRSDQIEAIECLEESPLQVEHGDYILVGSSDTKTCVATGETGDCTMPVTAQASSQVIVLTGTRLLELACPLEPGGQEWIPVDRIVYNEAWRTPTCGLESGHCSWALRPDARGAASPATANDDPQAWTTGVTPYRDQDGNTALGSPGAPNTVASRVAVTGPPGPGDVFVTEMMVDYGTTPEWVELQATDGGGYFELAGCWLLLERPGEATQEGEDGTPVVACSPDSTDACYKTYEIPPEVHFPIGEGDDPSLLRRVLAKGICLSYGEPAPEGTPVPEPGGDTEALCLETGHADFNYGTALDFSSSTLEAFALWCPRGDGSDGADYQLIDRFEYDWSGWDDLCTGTDGEEVAACSLSVHQDHANAEDNDCDFYRCVSASVEGAYYDTKGALCAGTPGEENACPAMPYTPRGLAAGPDARLLVIDEISMLPAGDNSEVGRFSNEWFELYNPGDESLDLASCRFLTGDELDDDGIVVEPDKTYAMAGNPVTIDPGQYQLWALDGCVMGSVASDAEASSPTPGVTPTPGDGEPGDVAARLAILDGSCDVPADVAYATLSFPNTTPKYFQLVCKVGCGQEEVIDTIYVDAEGQGIEEGHSWQLDPAFLDVEANDDPAHWCQASYSQVFGYEELGKNYGTPGEPNACVPNPECGDVAVSCRCDLGGIGNPRDRLPTALLLGVALIGLRLRSRSRA